MTEFTHCPSGTPEDPNFPEVSDRGMIKAIMQAAIFPKCQPSFNWSEYFNETATGLRVMGSKLVYICHIECGKTNKLMSVTGLF